MGLNMVPKRIFLTKGVGKHRERLTSFELALRDAGIAARRIMGRLVVGPAQAMGATLVFEPAA